jgi:hypothetical protein
MPVPAGISFRFAKHPLQQAFHVFETPCIFFILIILMEYSTSIMRKKKSMQIFTLGKALNQALPKSNSHTTLPCVSA